MKHINDREPNFKSKGQFYLVRCYACNKDIGTENYVLAVTTGQCYKCGWKHEQTSEHKAEQGSSQSKPDISKI